MARVMKKVQSANPSGLPLGASASSTKFKSIMVDVGLWQHLCGMKTEAEANKPDLLDMYEGAMAEQFVGQEMMVSQESDLYYWRELPRAAMRKWITWRWSMAPSSPWK